MSRLSDYLERVGYSGPVRPDLATLKALHRAHSLAIPYENIDVQMGRRLTTDPAAAFDKIVHRGRGGWCYEMNGVFGLALEEAGFAVSRLAGAAMREVVGDEQIGSHLVLLVDLAEGPYVADVGFGDGPIDPYPLAPGAFSQRGFPFELTVEADGWWRLRNQPYGGAKSMDFRPDYADEARMASRCAWLQTAEVSPFFLYLICQRHTPDGLRLLRGRVLRSVTPEGYQQRIIESLPEFEDMLGSVFGLSDPDTPALWERVLDRHAKSFADVALS